MTLERTGGEGRGVGVGAGIGAAGGIVGPRGKAARFSAGGAALPRVGAPRQFSRKRFQKKQQGWSNTPPARYFQHFRARTPSPSQSHATLSAFPHLNQRNTAQ